MAGDLIQGKVGSLAVDILAVFSAQKLITARV